MLPLAPYVKELDNFCPSTEERSKHPRGLPLKFSRDTFLEAPKRKLLYVSSRRGEHRLRMFENKVLRRIFGPKRDEVTGGWGNCIMRSFAKYN
jgi:hypothetical protein